MEQACIGSIRQLPVDDTRLRLDRLDIKILAALQSDGRMSNLKLSELVGFADTVPATRPPT